MTYRTELTEGELHELDGIFSYHPPQGDQPKRYEAIREGARAFSRILMLNAPSSADRSAALRKLRECVMTANAAIALERA